MTLQMKKKGGVYVVTWDSDASLEDSDSSDDDKKSKKKALASIAINNKLSLFNTPLCFMAKSTKVQKDEKKKHKKGQKEKKEKKITFQKKKKGGGYVVTWDSDGSLNSDDSSNDGKKSIKKAQACIAINNKPSIFDTPSTCLMAKPTSWQSLR